MGLKSLIDERPYVAMIRSAAAAAPWMQGFCPMSVLYDNILGQKARDGQAQNCRDRKICQGGQQAILRRCGQLRFVLRIGVPVDVCVVFAHEMQTYFGNI